MEFSGTSDYVSTLDLTLAVNASINLERPLLVTDKSSKDFRGKFLDRVLPY